MRIKSLDADQARRSFAMRIVSLMSRRSALAGPAGSRGFDYCDEDFAGLSGDAGHVLEF